MTAHKGGKWYNKEAGWVRKQDRRLARRRAKQKIREGKPEQIPPRKGTEGWQTY